MQMIADHFHNNKPAWSSNALARTLDVAEEAIELVIQALYKSALLVKLDNKNTWQPSRSLDSITIYMILDAIRKGEETTSLHPDDVPSDSRIENLIQQIDENMAASLNKMTLLDLTSPHE